MQGIRIRDLDEGGYLAFDLKELLAAVGWKALDAEWLCSDLWCIGRDEVEEEDLEREYDAGARIPGHKLAQLADQTRQVIDGRFQAYHPGDELPWLIIEAIDSSYWEVFSSDAEIVAGVRAAFNDVEEIQEWPS